MSGCMQIGLLCLVVGLQYICIGFCDINSKGLTQSPLYNVNVLSALTLGYDQHLL